MISVGYPGIVWFCTMRWQNEPPTPTLKPLTSNLCDNPAQEYIRLLPGSGEPDKILGIVCGGLPLYHSCIQKCTFNSMLFLSQEIQVQCRETCTVLFIFRELHQLIQYTFFFLQQRNTLTWTRKTARRVWTYIRNLLHEWTEYLIFWKLQKMLVLTKMISLI